MEQVTKAEQHLIDWGLPSLRRTVAVHWDYEGPSHRQRWPLASVTFANQFWTYERYLHISRVVPALFSVAGVSSPVELHSLGRMYGRPAVVQAASLPLPPPPPSSPRSWRIQGKDRCRYSLGTNGVARVAGMTMCCQTAFGTPAPDFLSGFTPLAFPKNGFTARQRWCPPRYTAGYSVAPIGTGGTTRRYCHYCYYYSQDVVRTSSVRHRVFSVKALLRSSINEVKSYSS